MPSDVDDTAFHVRHFAPDTDFPRMVHLLNEVEATDHSGNDISEETLRSHLTLPGHEPVLDRWVAEAPGDPDQLIAFALMWKLPSDEFATLYGAVHPAWRRRGLGNDLLRHALERAQEKQAVFAYVNADARHQAATNFLRQHGFEAVSANTEMRLQANIPLDTPHWPTGYQIRSYDAATDFPAMLRAYNTCFPDLWGHHEVSEEELKDFNIAFDGAFLLYDAGDEVVGICRAEMSQQLSERRGKRTGYVDAPGVVPEHRDKHLYLPLLLTALQWIRAQESIDIELESWGDAEQTLALYQKAGFTVVRQALSYKKVI